MPDDIPELCCALGACCDEDKAEMAFGRVLDRLLSGHLSVHVSAGDAQVMAHLILKTVDLMPHGTTYALKQALFHYGQQHPRAEP